MNETEVVISNDAYELKSCFKLIIFSYYITEAVNCSIYDSI